MSSTGGAEPADDPPEAIYRRIVESANLGIWALDPDGATTFANGKMSDILGYPSEEMATLTLFDVLDEEGKAQAAANLERRRRGESAQMECAFLRKDGTHVWLLVSASPLRDERGDYVGALCMASEITERKRVEALIQLGEQQLADAQRVAHLGSWEWDVITDQLSWSDELYRIFGLEPGDWFPPTTATWRSCTRTTWTWSTPRWVRPCTVAVSTSSSTESSAGTARSAGSAVEERWCATRRERLCACTAPASTSRRPSGRT